MTRIAIAILALCWAVMGCAGTDEYDDSDSDGAELGTSEQAIFSSPAGFGITDAFGRCTTSSTFCNVPSTKTIKYSTTCTGCDADTVAAISLGRQFWANRLDQAGWSTQLKPAGQAGEYISLVNGAVVPPHGVGGSGLGADGRDIDLVKQDIVQQQVKIGNTTFRKLTHCSVTVDFQDDLARIAAGVYGTSPCFGVGKACRQAVMADHVVRALGFCSGLGRDPVANESSMSDGPYGKSVAGQEVIRDYTSAERTELSNFTL